MGYPNSKWVTVANIPVDAGLCYIGDPCYTQGHNTSHNYKTWEKFLDDMGEDSYPTVADMDHGACVSTGFGDGRYTVKARIVDVPGWGKRVAEVRVIFIHPGECK